MSETTATGRDSRLPFTVLLADTPGQPIEIHDHSVGLHMLLVEKSSVHLLTTDWDVPGVYLLLAPVHGDGAFGVYVGKAPAGVRARLQQHERRRVWSRALLIRRATLHGLTSAHAGWLEGDLHELLTAAERAKVHNTQTPGDDTVASYDLRMLESFRDPIVRVLRLLGYETESTNNDPGNAPGPGRRRRTTTFHGITVANLITAGHLTGDERLVSVNRSWPATARINADGTISYNNRTYPTPSSAGSAVKGGAPVNGWDFWAVEGPTKSTRLSAIRELYLKDTQTRGDHA